MSETTEITVRPNRSLTVAIMQHWQDRATKAESELASWQARAEQAESTIAAWKKDAEDKAVLIAGQARDAALADAKAIEIGQPIGAVNPIYEDGYAAGWRNASHWWRERIEALRKQALSHSTDLEREDGKK